MVDVYFMLLLIGFDVADVVIGDLWGCVIDLLFVVVVYDLLIVNGLCVVYNIFYVGGYILEWYI